MEKKEIALIEIGHSIYIEVKVDLEVPIDIFIFYILIWSGEFRLIEFCVS